MGVVWPPDQLVTRETAVHLAAANPFFGNAAGAATAFEAALESHPNNAFALWGLWQAEDALAVDQGDAGRPFAARRAFERAWLGSGEPELSRL